MGRVETDFHNHILVQNQYSDFLEEPWQVAHLPQNEIQYQHLFLGKHQYHHLVEQ